MVHTFSKKTIDELAYYVYVYSDPDTHKPFYVGKGKGNRVFAHLTDENDNKKAEYIRNLKQKGKEPIIEILVHGVTEDVALKVEAAAIDLLGIENLTNKQRGHQSEVYGKIEVSLLENRYNCEYLNLDDIDDDIILIRINKQYRNDMTENEIYEAVRAYWRVNLQQATKAKYALAIYYGMVLEVYEIMEWFPAFSTVIYQNIENMDELKDRYEFVGRIASENIRKKYKDKCVSNIFSKGEQNPIRYIIHE